MAQDYLQIVYEPQTKIWKSVNYPHKNAVNTSLGDKFLNTMRSVDSNKIIDHFYDKNVIKTAKQVYSESIYVALNLQRLGIKKGDVIVLFSLNNEMTAVLTFGCILVGAVPNFFDVALQDESVDYIMQILQPAAIIYEEKYFHELKASLERINSVSLPTLISIDGSSRPNVSNDLLRLDQEVDFDNFKSVDIIDPQQEVACLVLTSGSTGVPKIVEITHTLMMHGCLIWWDNDEHYEPLTGDSVVFSFSPLRWISQISMLFQSLLFGLKRVSSCGAPTGQYGLGVLRATNITHIFVAPSIFYEILLQLNENDIDSLKSLKNIQLGGEPPSPVAVKLTKKHAVNGKTFCCYGMTEMCTCITNDACGNGSKPLPGYVLQILDDNLQPLGPNEPGQIALMPAVPIKGYKGIDNTKYLSSLGLFINGDYGFMDKEGKLHILGRYKDVIVSNGQRIVPNPLEYFVNGLPEVYVARLAGYRKTPDDPNEVGAFFVVLNSNATISHDEISAKIFETLKPHMSAAELYIIQDIHFVSAVPQTTCGKVDRVALKKLALAKSLK